MPVPKPVVKPISTKKGTPQTAAKPKLTTAAATKKATTSKKQSCDISYPFGSPYHLVEPVKKTTAEIKKPATIVEEYSGKNCKPVKKDPIKNKITSETSNAKSLKKDLAKSSTSTMTCTGARCYVEPAKKAPVKKVTNDKGCCYAEPTKIAQVKKITNSKEMCYTEAKIKTQPKSTSKKMTESAVRKLMLPTTRKLKTDCASGWCNWDSDMSTDGSEGCACGMCSFDDSECDDDVCHLALPFDLPKKKTPAKKATKSNKKCYLYN